MIASLFPGMEVPVPSVPGDNTGFEVAFRIDRDSIAPTDRESMALKLAEVKRHLLGAPIHMALSSLPGAGSGPASPRASASTPVITIPYRKNEFIYVCAGADKVVVIFFIEMSDDTDRAVARVFLQEFVEAQRSVGAAPPCSFTKERPLELRALPLPPSRPTTAASGGGAGAGGAGASGLRSGASGEAGSGDRSAGYLAFALEPRHVAGPKLEKAVALLAGFRPYLHYHIKASKTYMHMRMRKRVAQWLQVLNRAKPDTEEKEKKTASGRTFKRSV